MSVIRRLVRPESGTEEALARYVASIRAEIEPDPLFKRRLRGQVLNGFVAAREGVSVAPAEPGAAREMTRIGRAVLYASFGLALSVTTVMAAAQEAVPGDVLYPFKLQIEQLRQDVLPARFHDELAAIDLAERLEELGRLTEAREAARATALLESIRTEYAVFASELVDPSHAGALDDREVVIQALVERLPPPAAEAVEAVISEVDASLDAEPGSVPPDGNPGGANNDGSNPNGSSNGGGANNDGTPGSAGDAPGRLPAEQRGAEGAAPEGPSHSD